MNIALFSAAANATGAQIPNWFAVLMGIGTVFVGLISIIIICLITGVICGASKKQKETPVGSMAQKDGRVTNREMIAAVCAVCAEEMGTDVNHLKVVSFKKI